MNNPKYRYAVTTEDGEIFYSNDADGLNRFLEENELGTVLDMQEGRYSYDMAEWHEVRELEVPAEEDEDEDEGDDNDMEVSPLKE